MTQSMQLLNSKAVFLSLKYSIHTRINIFQHKSSCKRVSSR